MTVEVWEVETCECHVTVEVWEVGVTIEVWEVEHGIVM